MLKSEKLLVHVVKNMSALNVLLAEIDKYQSFGFLLYANIGPLVEKFKKIDRTLWGMSCLMLEE
jgi:hypothetical protein